MRSLRPTLVCLAAVLGLFALGTASGQQIYQYGFEARGPVWKEAGSDARYKVLLHELTSEPRHGGQKSEHIRVQVEKGTFIHYTYDLPRALITDELSVSLWLKSNRPGVQVLCRIVLPRERDPDNLSRPLTVLVRCEPYQYTRWKLIGLEQPKKSLRAQQQLLTLKHKRNIDVGGAYVDQLVLNVCDGAGTIDVWIDDLEVGPVLETKPEPGADPVAKSAPSPTNTPVGRRSSEVLLQGNQLKVAGQKFFLRGVRHSGTPLRTLRDCGFNTVWLDDETKPETVAEAASLGFWIVPTIQNAQWGGTGRVEGQFVVSESFAKKTARFLEQDAVLAWDLGTDLDAEQYPRALRMAEAFRAADPQRPLIADVWDGHRGFSRTMPQLLLGTHRWPLFTSMELASYRDWLEMRRRLTIDHYSWTWIQTHLPDWYTRLVYESDGKKGFREPIGPQPEQIRLLAYCAMGAGYRGLAFWSDRYLADSHRGRDRLLGLALLNQEIRLLEPILNQATQRPEWIGTSRPEVQAAIIRTPQAVLVLPIWLGSGSQFVPGQSASSELHLTVQVANTATAWEVSPGRIQSQPLQRVQGGCTIRLRNFSLASALVFTSDLGPKGIVVTLQEQQRRMGRLAAQWLCDQAKEELTKVEQVQEQLAGMSQALPDSADLLKKARESLDRAVRHRRDGEHAAAYTDAEIALRALRLLMRSQWDRAVRDLDSPVSSPYALSYFTLPKHWELLARLKQMRPGASLLSHGDFELPPDEVQAGWVVQEAPSLDAVETRVRRIEGQAHAGKRCLAMEISPRDPKRPPLVLERTYLALRSPVVRLRPGTLVRISAWVRTPGPISSSTDGALIHDSIGGEPLAIRITDSPKWRKVSLYRRVPASGEVSLTLAMSGLGTVYFDDVRIEPLEEGMAGR